MAPKLNRWASGILQEKLATTGLKMEIMRFTSENNYGFRASWLASIVRQNQTMSGDVDQIQERKPVWCALSELFLDTNLEASDIERIAQRLAASPFSTSKIEEILRFEVTPPLKWNMMVVAGEWAGFDEDWLCERISPRIDRKPFIRFPIFRMIQHDWRKIKARIREIRKESGA